MAPAVPLVSQGITQPLTWSERIRYTIQDVDAMSRETGVVCESPELEAVGGKWEIRVYLGGKDQAHAGHVSVYLNWKGKLVEKPTDVCFKIRAVNQSDATKSETHGGPQNKWAPPGNGTSYGYVTICRVLPVRRSRPA